MRKQVLPGIAATICLLGTLSAAHAGGIAWTNSLSRAMAEARKTNKLVMIDFYTDWCGWCKRLDADTYTSSVVIQATQQVIPVKVNAEKEGLQAARKYGVSGFPTILFINSNGDVEGRIGGYEPPAPFAQTVNTFVNRHKELPIMESQFRSHPTASLAARLTRAYATQGNPQKAANMLAQVQKLDPAGSQGFLTKSMLNVADVYQGTGQFGRAISLFQRVLKTSNQPAEQAYAHISIAVCDLQQNKIDPAVPELKATMAVSNCPPQLKQAAQAYLTRIQQFKSQHP